VIGANRVQKNDLVCKKMTTATPLRHCSFARRTLLCPVPIIPPIYVRDLLLADSLAQGSQPAYMAGGRQAGGRAGGSD
jgi:hypothetical protein